MKNYSLKIKMAFSVASLAFLLFLGACSSDEPATGGSTTVTAPKIELTAPASRAAAAVQDFNIDFFRNVALYDDYKGKNVACSPMSATMLLSLLSNAASDETAAEIAAELGYSDRNDLNELYATLATKLPSLDSKATLSFANSVWYHKEYTLTDNFSSIAKEYYKADIFKRDLSGKTIGVTDEINSWVNDNTNGLIKEVEVLLPTLSTLINAAYFKADWKDKFKPENTDKATFKGVAGDSQIDMMHRTGSYLYERTEAYEAIEMPFGAGAFTAAFIMPSGDLEAFIDSDALSGLWSNKPNACNIDLSLPKFKIAEDEEINLTNILRDMGVKSLVNPGMMKLFNESPDADFFSVNQKTSVEFSEQGAEAASVTWTNSDISNGYIPVSFDRPFVFMITEKSTKTILFAGKIMSL